jgi:hypothetical protein
VRVGLVGGVTAKEQGYNQIKVPPTHHDVARRHSDSGT